MTPGEKRLNDEFVALLEKHGPLSALDLSLAVKITRSVAYQTVKRLRAAGLVHISGFDKSVPSHPALFTPGPGVDAVRKSAMMTPEQRLEQRRHWDRASQRKKLQKLRKIAEEQGVVFNELADVPADARPARKAMILAGVAERQARAKALRDAKTEAMRIKAIPMSSVFRMGGANA